jgi:HAD superfamily hydrolase (TIGR01509 family)
MRLEAILFDFNGVLLWDSELHEQTWKQFAITIRGKTLSDEEIVTRVHGRSNRQILEYLAGHPLDADHLERLSQHKESFYQSLCLAQQERFRLSPGAVELLDFLVEHRIPRTIATASGKDNLDFFVEHLHLDQWFDTGQIVYDDGVRSGKPAPDIYLQAARNLGIEPRRCMGIEDSRSGLQAAHAAGIGCIVALGPARTHSDLARLEGVSQVVETLHQVPRQLFF